MQETKASQLVKAFMSKQNPNKKAQKSFSRTKSAIKTYIYSKKFSSISKILSIALLSCICICELAESQDCFPQADSKFPKITGKTGTTNVYSEFLTIIANNAETSLFMGGSAYGDSNEGYLQFQNLMGLIQRTDLATNTVAWTMSYGEQSSTQSTITALAIGPINYISDEQLFVYALDSGHWNFHTQKFKLFRVRTSDGGRIGLATSFQFDESLTFKVGSQNIAWTKNDRVYIAFTQQTIEPQNGVDGTIFAVGRYKPASGDFDRYKKTENEGHAACLIQDPDTDQYLVGGSYSEASNSWTPAIVILDKDLNRKQIVKFEFSRQYSSTDTQRDMNDNNYMHMVTGMKIHRSSTTSNHKVFGYTKYSNINLPNRSCSFFKVDYDQAQSDEITAGKQNVDWIEKHWHTNEVTGMEVMSLSEYDESFGGFYVLFKVYEKLWHMKVDFQSISFDLKAVHIATSSTYLQEWHFGAGIFLKSGLVQTHQGENILQGYACGRSKTLQTASLQQVNSNSDFATTYAFLPSQTCQEQQVGSMQIRFKELSTNSGTFHQSKRTDVVEIQNNTEDYQFNDDENPAISDVEINQYSMDMSQDGGIGWDDLCSTYSPNVSFESTPILFATPAFCTNDLFDDNESIINFTEPSIAVPTTCTDSSANIVRYYFSDYSQQYGHYDKTWLSIDRETSEIRVFRKNDLFSGPTDFTVTVNAQYPNGYTVSQQIYIQIGQSDHICDTHTIQITPPPQPLYNYQLGDATDTVQFSEFMVVDSSGYNVASCAVFYSAKISLPVDYDVIKLRQDKRGASWYSNDMTYPQTLFTVTVTGTTGCQNSKSASYQVQISPPDPCLSDVLVISPTKFEPPPQPTKIYNLYDNPVVLQWDVSHVTSQNNLMASCGDISWEILPDNHPASIDPTLFAITYATGQKGGSLTVQSQDPNTSIQDYNFKVRVWYVKYYLTSLNESPFFIRVQNPCENSITVSVVGATQLQVDYKIGDTLLTIPNTIAHSIVPDYCPVTYSVNPVSPNPPNASDIQTYPLTQTTTIQTNLPSFANDSTGQTPTIYHVEYYVLTPTGSLIANNQILDLQIRVFDHCALASLTIKHNLFQNQVYVIGVTNGQLEQVWETYPATSDTQAFCGPMVVNFYEQITNDPLPDPPIFQDHANNKIGIRQVTDPSQVGYWIVYFSVSFQNYPQVVTHSTNAHQFYLQVFDSCANPVSISPNGSLPISNQIYTITQPELIVQFAPFTVDPALCTSQISINYVLSSSPSNLMGLVSLDASNLQIKFFENQSLQLAIESASQQSYAIYTVTMMGFFGNMSGLTQFDVTIKNPCYDPNYNQILTPTNPILPTEFYQVNSAKKIIKIDQLYTQMESLCGPVEMQLQGNVLPQVIANQIQLQYEVYTTNFSLIGTSQRLTVLSRLQNFQDYQGTVIEIPLNFVECTIDEIEEDLTIENKEYELGQLKMEFEVPEITNQSIKDCNFGVNYHAELVEANQNGIFELPSEIQFDSWSRKFTIQGSQGSSRVGVYQIQMIATLENPQQTSYVIQFEVNILKANLLADYIIYENLLPEPSAELKQKHTFIKKRGNYEEIQKILLGSVTDPESNSFSIEQVGSSQIGMILETSPNGEIFAKIDNNLVQSGNFTLDYEIVEQVNATFSRSVQHYIQLEVKSQSLDEGQNHTETLTTFDLIYPAYDKDKDIKAEAPNIEFVDIDMFGFATLKFSESLIIPSDLANINSTVFEISILAQSPTLLPELAFTWELVSFKAKEAKISLKFDNPLMISQERAKDKLQIKVIDPTLLLSQETFKRVQNETLDECKIPQQHPNAQIARMTQEFAQNQQTVLLVGAGSSFLLNFILMGSLSLLWGLIHAMQVVAFLPLLNIKIPPNVLILYMTLYEMANFDLIPTDGIKDFLMTQYYQTQIESDTQEVDNKIEDEHMQEFFDNADLLHNTLPFTVILVIFGGILLLSRFNLWLFSNHSRALSIHRNLKNKIFWNSPIRLFLEEYLLLSITTMIKIKALAFTGIYQSVNSGVAILSLIFICVAIPLLWYILVIKNFEKIKKRSFQSKYGTLTTDLNRKSKWSLLYYAIFMLRRVSLAIVIVGMYKLLSLQVNCVVMQCAFIVIYIGQVRPYRVKQLNKLELFNEFMILLNTYFAFLYDDLILKSSQDETQDEKLTDVEMKFKIGWVNFGWLSILVFTNFFWMIGIQLQEIYKRLRKQYHKRQLKFEIRVRIPRKLIQRMKRKLSLSHLRNVVRGQSMRSTPVQFLPDARRDASTDNPSDWEQLQPRKYWVGNAQLQSQSNNNLDIDIFEQQDEPSLVEQKIKQNLSIKQSSDILEGKLINQKQPIEIKAKTLIKPVFASNFSNNTLQLKSKQKRRDIQENNLEKIVEMASQENKALSIDNVIDSLPSSFNVLTEDSLHHDNDIADEGSYQSNNDDQGANQVQDNNKALDQKESDLQQIGFGIEQNVTNQTEERSNNTFGQLKIDRNDLSWGFLDHPFWKHIDAKRAKKAANDKSFEKNKDNQESLNDFRNVKAFENLKNQRPDENTIRPDLLALNASDKEVTSKNDFEDDLKRDFQAGISNQNTDSRVVDIKQLIIDNIIRDQSRGLNKMKQ